MSFLYFFILVGVLVTIHEFGHFLAAKAVGIQVLRFSIGFGRPLVRWKVGNTEFQLAMFPLGGYVRLLGEDALEDVPSELRDKSYSSQSVSRKLLVIFAGPLANIVVALVLFGYLHSQTSALPAPNVGTVLPNSPAAEAGLQAGDLVEEIDGRAITSFEDLEMAVKDRPGRKISVVVDRQGKTRQLSIKLHEETYRTRTGGLSTRGYLGIVRDPVLPVVGILDLSSPATLAGLQTGDIILSVGQSQVSTWLEVLSALESKKRSHEIVYLRPRAGINYPGLLVLEPAMTILPPKETGHAAALGIASAELFVADIRRGSPAEACGLTLNDQIVEVGGSKVNSWRDVDQLLMAAGDEPVSVIVHRAVSQEVKVVTLSCQQRWVDRADQLGAKSRFLTWGASNKVVRDDTRQTPITKRFNYTISNGISETIQATGMLLSGIGAVLVGRDVRASLGGPLTVYYAATYSGEAGWRSFLRLLALISINLALLNLLPVPVLDGGQATIVALEAVRGQPLRDKTRRMAHLIGMGGIALLTLLALRNDIVRFVL